MILVIDGYNVIKQAMMKSEISDCERIAFIKQLGKYCKTKGHKALLVFDAGQSDCATKESLHGVTVIYSGHRESADDYIKDYLKRNRALDLLLVSTDRDICRHASGLNIEQIDARDFYDIMCAEVSNFVEQRHSGHGGQALKAVKTSKIENSELDSVMQESSKFVNKKSEDMQIDGLFTGIKQNKISKKEAKKLKKIKKL